MSNKFTKPIHWKNEGTEPSENLKNTGFQGGYKQPAGIFNYFFSIVEKCFIELQNAAEKLDTDKVDKIEDKSLSANDYTTAEKNKLSGIAAGAQVNTVTGIKGNAETSYRTGNVNLTPANIGAAAASHSHNYAGSSSAGGSATSAVKLAAARTINGVTFDGTANITVPRSTKCVHAVNALGEGYFKICTIKVNAAWADSPHKFTVTQRHIGQFDIIIGFSGGNTTDPTLSFAFITSEYGNVLPHAYYFKSATSTWDIYVKRTENYDAVYVTDFQKANGDEGNTTAIAWKDEVVSSLPTGCIEFSRHTYLTPAERTKLSGIEAGAQANLRPEVIYDSGTISNSAFSAAIAGLFANNKLINVVVTGNKYGTRSYMIPIKSDIADNTTVFNIFQYIS